jgi:Cft2 family RNA processing exonuclease
MTETEAHENLYLDVSEFLSIGRIFAASPTATICSVAGLRYFCATRCTSSAITAAMRRG